MIEFGKHVFQDEVEYRRYIVEVLKHLTYPAYALMVGARCSHQFDEEMVKVFREAIGEICEAIGGSGTVTARPRAIEGDAHFQRFLASSIAGPVHARARARPPRRGQP